MLAMLIGFITLVILLCLADMIGDGDLADGFCIMFYICLTLLGIGFISWAVGYIILLFLEVL